MKSEIEKILNKKELKIVKKLKDPIKIQNFLDSLPFNFETNGESYMSPRKMLNLGKAHCFEGAIFASLCLTYNDYNNFLIDLKVKESAKEDSDHIICVFMLNGFYGSISKTNHSVLRFRDPIYKTEREVIMSYFNEYFLDNGEKTLYSYSKPFDLFKYFGTGWIISENDLDEIAEKIDKSPHILFVPEINKKFIKKATKIETKILSFVEWKKSGKRNIMDR